MLFSLKVSTVNLRYACHNVNNNNDKANAHKLHQYSTTIIHISKKTLPF